MKRRLTAVISSPWALISAMGLLSFGRLMFLHGDFQDDSAWLLSAYASDSLGQFLDYGFNQLRRPLMGVFFYYYYGLHELTLYSYELWHAMIIATQIGTALCIYRLMKLIGAGGTASLGAAIVFLGIPLDTTIAMNACINYRLGLLLAVVSLFLTARGAAPGAERRGVWLSLAALSALISYGAFLESSVALEPARMLMIYHMQRPAAAFDRKALRRTLALMLPFVVVALPFVAYKLLYKPYGVYEGFYAADPAALLNLKNYKDLIMVAAHFFWASALLYIDYARPMSYAMLLAGMTMGWLVVRALAASEPYVGRVEGSGWFIPWFGGMLFIVPAAMYLALGKPPRIGVESRNAIVLGLGASVIGGAVMQWLVVRLRLPTLARALVMVWIAAAIFFHNLNLDLYDHMARAEQGLWAGFAERVEGMPEGSSLFLDVVNPIGMYDEMVLYYDYQYDYPLNMLYAESSAPGDFYRLAVFKGYSMPGNVFSVDLGRFSLWTNWGEKRLKMDRLLVASYDGSDLLINREILDKYPGAPYAGWIRKWAVEPALRAGRTYPLREYYMRHVAP